MAKAFSQKETDIILKKLKASARRYAVSCGMRKITVEELAKEAVLEACKLMGQSGMMDFMEQDVPFLLRRIPAEVLEEHYHGDEAHIKELLENVGLEPEGGMELASAVVRGLFLTVSHRGTLAHCIRRFWRPWYMEPASVYSRNKQKLK